AVPKPNYASGLLQHAAAASAEPNISGGFTQLFNPKAAAAVLSASQARVSSGSFSKVFAATPASPAPSQDGFIDLFNARPQVQGPVAQPTPAPPPGGFTQLFNGSAPTTRPDEPQPAASSFSRMFNASATP